MNESAPVNRTAVIITVMIIVAVFMLAVGVYLAFHLHHYEAVCINGVRPCQTDHWEFN